MDHTFFAQPPSQSKITNAIQKRIPKNLQYLASGVDGDVLIYNNPAYVVKINKKGKYIDHVEDTKKEFNILQAVWRMAPDYVPVPSTLTNIDGNIGIQMPNVGNALLKVLPHKHPRDQSIPVLLPDEIALCMLQSIHFILLINDKVKLGDLHEGNVCTQWRDADIRIRFIDTAAWSKYDVFPKDEENFEEMYCWMDVVINNSLKMFWDEDDQEGLWNDVFEVYKDRIKHQSDTSDAFILQLMRIMNMFEREYKDNIYTALLNMAGRIQDYIIASREENYITRCKTLLEQISHAHWVAIHTLRPSKKHNTRRTM